MRTDFLHKNAEAVLVAEEVVKPSGAMTLKIAATDAAYLQGTYSQTFVSEMAVQLTEEIESRLLVCGLAQSDIALELVFAPGTYMEHPQDAYTYRRLLISENGRAIKDLWIRWQRLDEGKNFTVCDEVTSENIRFSLGEDVPQKVREKEYRFLVQADAEQYRTAMGRKNVTEWREIIKRALKRGALTKLTLDDKVAEHAEQIKDKLEELLGKITPAAQPQTPVADVEEDETYAKAMEFMRGFVESNGVKIEEDAADTAEEMLEPEISEEESDEPALEIADAAADAVLEEAVEEELDAQEAEDEEAEEELVIPAFDTAPFAKEPEPSVDVDAIRAELEKKLRAEMEEKERELLRREYVLEQQKQAFAAEMKEQEQNRAERENELRRQAQNQARLEWEAKERDRLTAQAKEAIEARKAEEARIAEEARKAEEARIAEEARKAEEARIAEEARKAEEARIAEEARRAEEARKAEEARRAAEEARKAEEARRAAEEARKAEEARRAAEEAAMPLEARLAEQARAAVEARFAEETRAAEASATYTYTEKLVHLIFRHPVDPNVISRIHELMKDTIRYFKKEAVFIKVRASIPSEDTVDLHFTQFPEEENQLLIDMIQVLGNSDLGICRVLVD